jgi:hypothetical protein
MEDKSSQLIPHSGNANPSVMLKVKSDREPFHDFPNIEGKAGL